MQKIISNNKSHKMQFLESAFYDIINTIGILPAESGGLLFGKEDDYVVRKFIFDKHAKVTRSSYTFTTEFLNPEIKRIWNDEGLSVIGFIHSHPYGYGRLSSPDLEYFSGMFESMPRKHYLTPIVFTGPDGGFRMHAHILPNGSKETIQAHIEILPDDYYSHEKRDETPQTIEKDSQGIEMLIPAPSKIDSVERILWQVWKLIIAYSLGWFLLNILCTLTIHLNKIWLL